MKKHHQTIDEKETKLSQLLFTKSQDLLENLKSTKVENVDLKRKPVWIDEDDLPTTKIKGAISDQRKQKYENLVGTPNWAKLNTKIESRDDNDEIIRTVGHLEKKRPESLPRNLLGIRGCPKINAETRNEGPISCIEFHPKLSVSLVAGKKGLVSLFSLGGDTNNKLHSFQLKGFNVTSAQFTPDGSSALIASTLKHDYCLYNLTKAEPKLIQLPQSIKKAVIFKLSPDGKYIAVSEGFNEIAIVSALSYELLKSLKQNTKVVSVAFSSDSDLLYSYGIEGEITVWNMSTFRAVKKFYDQGCVTASVITTSFCGRLLATGSGEGIINIYETSSITTAEPNPLKTISNLQTKISSLKFNSTAEILGATSVVLPNAVRLIHIPSYNVFSNFPDPKFNLHELSTVNFSPNSGFMGLGNNKGCAFLYRLKYYKNY